MVKPADALPAGVLRQVADAVDVPVFAYRGVGGVRDGRGRRCGRLAGA